MYVLKHTRAVLTAVLVASAGLALIGPVASSDAQVVPAAAPTRVMAIGDSITEARTASQGIPSYRAALWDQLQTAGANVDFVGSRHGVLDNFNRPSGMAEPGGSWDKDHDGHYGWRADEILNGKNPGDGKLADWLTAHTPDVLIVHIGTNDVVQGETVNNAIGDVRQIVLTARVQNPGIDVVLASLISSKTSTRQAAIVAFNLALPGLVAELDTPGSRVVLGDLASGYNSAWNYDDLHPGATGQAHMATRFATALLSNGLLDDSPPPPPGVCGASAEAEDGVLTGTMVATSFAGASGNVVLAPNWTGSASNSGHPLEVWRHPL